MMTFAAIKRRAGLSRFSKLGAAVVLASALINSIGAALAAPAAGTSIGNQASATYSDASATVRTVTSNTVITIVQQVASLTLTANGAKNVALGGQVSYPHTLTNTGNGTDTFALSVGNTGAFSMTSVLLYADANGDGVPDNAVPITTSGELAAGAIFKFVAVGVVPVSAVAGNTNTITVTSTSTFTGSVTANNTDVTTVSSNAVINVTKAIDVAAGLPGSGPRTYTLTYTNIGVGAATNLTLADVIPSGMTYVAASARWSSTGATVLTDANAADNQSGVIYDFNVTTANRVTAVIASVPVGASGTLSFQVNVNANALPGANAATLNTASYTYNDGAVTTSSTNTNSVQFVVTQAAAVTLSGSTVASAPQGGTVTFTDTVTNTGNGTDSFDITTGVSTFPVGTTFTLYKADGVTPLIDSNGNGVPDTGPLAPAGTMNVVIKANLPAGSTGGSYTVKAIAVSKVDPTKTANADNTLTTIATSTVDLTNNSFGVGAPGLGAGPEGSPVVTVSATAGSIAHFTLYVANGSGVADTFNLQASTDVNFAGLTLPTGWTVAFKDVNGAIITNTGVINAGSNVAVYADVTVPAGTLAATTDVFFRALSPTSGANDRLHDAIQISGARTLTLTPNHTGQASSGGTVVYTHTITNNGNVLEGDGVISLVALTTADSGSGFSSTVYWDQNNNGVLDVTDPAVTTLAQLVGGTNGASTAAGLAPGEKATLFVKVYSAPGAATGASDTATLTATVTGLVGGVAVPAAVSAAVSVTDSTTIIAGDLQLVILQALDAACDGTADTAFAATIISGGAIPGACIRYQITATNVGSSDVTAVIISNATPANTKYHATVAATTSRGSVTTPSANTVGTVQATVGTLTPTQTAVLTYGVRIDP
ncbi:MAG: hypothetical protein JWM78_277 [Verrucomicrobiaceae bacterium]|nr:hypothetical protein [Verrucomicrobiaceae bacterium]